MKRLSLILLSAVICIGLYTCNRRHLRSNEPIRSQDDVGRSLGDNSTKVEPPTGPPAVGVTSPNPSTPSEITKDPVAAGYFAAVQTPISFWGKVVDNNGSPISGATATVIINNKIFKSGSQRLITTDLDGRFSITDVRGLAVSVSVQKEGYSQTGRSRAVCGYAVHAGNDIPIPSASNPAIFVLRKRGDSVPLLVQSNNLPILSDGRQIAVPLNTPPGSEVVSVEVGISDLKQSSNGRYDWKCRIFVPNGGIQARTDPLDFEAPQDGYHKYEEINMLSNSEHWSPQSSGDYFVMFNGDLYARVTVHIVTNGDRFSTIVSYLNPTPGSRNLEFDPKKQIKPH